MVNRVLQPGKDRAALLPNGVQDRHWELADKAQEWAANMTDEDMGGNDYLWNLHVIASQTALPPKAEGYAASLIPAYQREMGRRVEQKRKAEEHAAEVSANGSEWIGKPGDRIDFERLTVQRVSAYDGDYGTTYKYVLRDDSNNLLYWSKSGPISYNVDLSDAEVTEAVESINSSRQADIDRVRNAAIDIADGGDIVELQYPMPAYREGTVAYYALPKRDWEIALADPAAAKETFKDRLPPHSYWPSDDNPSEKALAARMSALLGTSNSVRSATIKDRPYTADDVRAEPSSFGLNTERIAEPGDIFSLRATVKEHNHFRDEKQTVITNGYAKSIRWLGNALDENAEKADAA
jgi:hypothetical protein